MRLEDAGPRTWLLASVAGWALLAWVRAMAGMGGRVEPLPPDPDLLRPLPQARQAPPPRLGDLAEYSEVAARPLFATDRRPRPFTLQGQGEAAESRDFDYVLTGVLITPKVEMAILQPSGGGDSVRVRLGAAPEPQPDWRLVELEPRSAVFEGPDGRRSLSLRTFDGVGGAPPTAVSEPRRPDADSTAAEPPRDADGRLRVPSAATAPVPATQPPRSNGQSQQTNGQPQQTNGQPGSAAAQPMTDQARMEAIRRRIQERREKLRGDSSSPPPAQSQ